MSTTMAVSRLGPAPSPSAVQWRLSSKPLRIARRRVSVGPVRASKRSEDGDVSGSTGLSRRAVIALIALSAPLAGVASARNTSGSEKVRLEMLRNIQQQKKSPVMVVEDLEIPSPATVVDTPGPIEASAASEVSSFPSLTAVDAPFKLKISAAEPPAPSLVNTDLRFLKEVPSALAGEVSLPQEIASDSQEKINQSVSEVSSGGNNGFGISSLAGVLGTGVAGALYHLERQTKIQAESALDAANKKLKEAEVSMASLRQTSEGQLLAEKEQAQYAANIAQEQRTTLTNELMASKTSVTELEGKLKMEKASVVDLQTTIARLQSTLTDEEKRYRSLNETFVEEKAVGMQLQKEISRLQSTLADQGKTYNSLNERLAEEIAVGQQLREEIQELKVYIETKENVIGVQNARIKGEEDTVAMLQAQLQTAETHLADERNTLKNLEATYASSQDRNKQLETSISDLKQKLKSTNNTKEELEKEVTSLNETVNSVKGTLAEEKEKKNVLSGQLMEASGALEKATAHVQSLEQRITEMSAAAKAFEKEKKNEINNLTRDLQEKSKSLDGIVERNQILSDEITTLKSRQRVLNEELENTHQDLEASTNEIKTISEQLTVAVNLSLKLETQLNETRAAYQSTHAALVEERKVMAAAKNQLATSQRSLIAEKNSVKALRGSVDQALQALQELNQDSVALADDLDKAKKHIANVESESASVRQKLVKEKEASASLRAGTVKAEGTISKLVKENDTVNKMVKQLEGELLKSKGEIARQKGKLLEQKRALQQAETRLKMIPQVRAEAALLVEKYEDLAFQEKEEKEALIRQNEKLLKSGKNVGADLTDVKQSLEDGKAARSEMEAALGALQEAVADNSS